MNWTRIVPIDRLRDRIEVVRYDPPAVGYKQLGVVILAMIMFAAGAFIAGRRVERQWWRSEIAQRSATANAIMSKLDAEMPDHDERLIKEWVSHDLDALRAAERAVADASRKAQSPAAPDDPCRPMPAHCLRR